MIDQETKDYIDKLVEGIEDRAAEKALIMLPEVVGSLYRQKAEIERLKNEFYRSDPSFLSHKDIVADVLREIDDKNPGKMFKDILDMAKPIIKSRIETIGRLDLHKGSRPSKEELTIKDADYGVL